MACFTRTMVASATVYKRLARAKKRRPLTCQERKLMKVAALDLAKEAAESGGAVLLQPDDSAEGVIFIVEGTAADDSQGMGVVVPSEDDLWPPSDE